MNKDYLFTSESVSEGHPDKVCDIISDSVVDDYLAQENPENSRVAMETLVTTNKVVMAGEVRGPFRRRGAGGSGARRRYDHDRATRRTGSRPHRRGGVVAGNKLDYRRSDPEDHRSSRS